MNRYYLNATRFIRQRKPANVILHKKQSPDKQKQMTFNSFSKNKQVDLLMYAHGRVVHITFSSVVKNGLLTVENKNGETVLQKIVTNTNYTYLTVPACVTRAKITFVSEEIQYRKDFNFHLKIKI